MNSPVPRPGVPAAGSAAMWLHGARPRTLPAAIVPVAVGTAAAVGDGVIWWRAAMALVVAVAIQIGTNFANDYSDGIRGTDDETRVGPARLVGDGLASPAAVKRATQLSFAVAAAAGLSLVVAVSWWLIVVGTASLLAGWFYTGGSRPYGYAGFGELFVFIFFGLVATVGSTFVQTESISALSWLAAVAVGFWATALMVTNNLRDIPTDTESDKVTLAVRLGDGRTRVLYIGLLLGAFVVVALVGSARPWALIALLALPLGIRPIRTVAGGTRGSGLVAVLADTGRLQLVAGSLFAAGIALSG